MLVVERVKQLVAAQELAQELAARRRIIEESKKPRVRRGGEHVPAHRMLPTTARRPAASATPDIVLRSHAPARYEVRLGGESLHEPARLDY
jgi:hypothetical protein